MFYCHVGAKHVKKYRIPQKNFTFVSHETFTYKAPPIVKPPRGSRNLQPNIEPGAVYFGGGLSEVFLVNPSKCIQCYRTLNLFSYLDA